MQTRVHTFIQNSIKTFKQVSDILTDEIEQASTTMVSSILADGKILTCGNGSAAICAQYFTLKLLNHVEQQRPSLPAITLTTDSTSITAIADDYHFAEIYSKQIRAIGNNKDILLVITSNNSPSIIQAIQAAHDREMLVIALTSSECNEIKSLLLPDDIDICVPNYKMTHIQQTHLLIIDCLCDLIDYQLFGTD